MNFGEHIITIHSRNVAQAHEAFAFFMSLLEQCFNERSQNNPHLYKNCSPSELELATEQILKEVAPQTPFRAEDIRLVAGHSFPDILATDFYGVEVKSTVKDKWVSTGSSIIESTKNESIERIYMLFGALGCQPPRFRCKPYQDCLSNIAVTHSPRYLIDMNLDASENIFAKMAVEYETFSQCSDSEKIKILRQYYLEKARREKRIEMPWWMGDDTKPTLSFYADLPTKEKERIVAQAFILFPEVLSANTRAVYKQIALWLCNRYSLLIHNMRDFFSAGGQIIAFKGKTLSSPLPQVFKKLKDHQEQIEKILTAPSERILQDICELWNIPTIHDLPQEWINKAENIVQANPKVENLSFREFWESDTIN